MCTQGPPGLVRLGPRGRLWEDMGDCSSAPWRQARCQHAASRLPTHRLPASGPWLPAHPPRLAWAPCPLGQMSSRLGTGLSSLGQGPWALRVPAPTHPSPGTRSPHEARRGDQKARLSDRQIRHRSAGTELEPAASPVSARTVHGPRCQQRWAPSTAHGGQHGAGNRAWTQAPRGSLSPSDLEQFR